MKKLLISLLLIFGFMVSYNSIFMFITKDNTNYNREEIVSNPKIVLAKLDNNKIKETLSSEDTFKEPESINYIETLETFNNPERGFYEPVGLGLKPSGNKVLNYSSNLVHLRVNLGAFSKKNNGTSDLELTEDALSALSMSLKNIKAKGGSVIIRFAYDNFDGKANVEPSLVMILRHIEQLREVFYENREVITYVELGFFGPWGEMHTSKVSTTANVSLAIDKMLDAVPPEISIGVRTPNYYAAWVGIERSKLHTFKSLKGTKYYRVGLYNDGYLGSESDLGTFSNRNKEISWLYEQAKHTFYGGEVVANFGKIPLNTVDYMSKEAFITHTTYLNLRWNYNTINNWKKEIYKGEDTLYVGESGFKYIDNHLGYRFVLRNSVLKNNITNKDNLDLNLDIENVGFANLINNKKVTIVLENNDHLYEIATEIDPTLWNSKSITNIKRNIKLSDDIALGTYRVYLRISYYGDLTSDNNYKAIRLANDGIWNSKIGANYIGKINITEYVPPKEEKPVTPKPPEIITDEPTYEPPKSEDSNLNSKEENKVEENKVEENKKDDNHFASNEKENNENIKNDSNLSLNEEKNEGEKKDDNSNLNTNEEETKDDSHEIISHPVEKEVFTTKKANNTLPYLLGGLIAVIFVSFVLNYLLNKISK